MQRRGDSFIKSGSIFLNHPKSTHTLLFNNNPTYIDHLTRIALKEIGFRLDENFHANDVKRNVTITCPAVSSRGNILRNFVLPTPNHPFYCDISFEDLYFVGVNKIYPELAFECDNREIFLDRMVVLYYGK